MNKELFFNIESWQMPVFIKSLNMIFVVNIIDAKLSEIEIIKRYELDK